MRRRSDAPCVYDNAKKIHEWTGGGLHAASDPGNNKASGCYLELIATTKGFERAKIPTTDGPFNCDAKQNGFVIKEGSDVGTHLSDVGKTLNDL